MPLFEAVRLALQTIRAQKLKSAFSIIGVFIGVMFLIAVVSVVQGMNRYMTDKFAGTILGVNTFRLRQFPDKLFEDEDPIGREVKIFQLPYRVIGVVEKQGNLFGLSLDKFVVAPASAPLKHYINPPRVVDALAVKANSQPAMREAMAQAEATMRSRRHLRPREPDDFALETADEVLDFWGKISRVLFVALPGLVAISLVVGGIVIMNIMLMAVAERTREIGIRKSLGARRRDILRQFLVEATTLATAGATGGVALGSGLAGAVAALTPLPAAVAPWSILVGVVLGGGVGVIAGVYPASRAARLDPIAALRHET